MSLLFRPIRMIMLCGVAFVAGVFYERSNQHTSCTALGGVWTTADLCAMEAQDG
ncbi:MAG: hypothetical protein AB8B82_12760 [Roseovarius sp.]